MMTPEQRLDRLERVTMLLVKSGRRTRSQWWAESRAQSEKINILIQTQMETTEQIRAQGEQIQAENERTNAQIRAQRKELNAQIRAQRKELNAQIRAQREELNAQIRAHTEEVNAQIQAQKEELNAQIRAQNEQTNAQIRAHDDKILALAEAQAKLSKSQDRTDKALRAFINSLRKRGNGHSSS